MKKRMIVLITVLLLMTGCGKNPARHPGRYIELSAVDLRAKFDAKESFIFFVAQTTCENCAKYFGYLDEYLKDHALTIYYVVADAEVNEETFDEIWDTYFPMVERTPTTVVVVNGVIQTAPAPAEGYLTTEEIGQYLEDSKISLPNE